MNRSAGTSEKMAVERLAMLRENPGNLTGQRFDPPWVGRLWKRKRTANDANPRESIR